MSSTRILLVPLFFAAASGWLYMLSKSAPKLQRTANETYAIIRFLSFCYQDIRKTKLCYTVYILIQRRKKYISLAIILVVLFQCKVSFKKYKEI